MNSISPKARIHESVEVGPFTTIYDNVEIGEGTWIGPNVTIMNGARIGKNCKIFPGAVISAVPQDLKYKGEESLTEVGDNTTIRECVTINRGTLDRMTTRVGSNCLLMAYSHVAHDCLIGNNVIIANCVQLAGHVIIEDYANLGGTTAVQQFITVGAHSMVGGGSLVRKDVPPFVRAARDPLSYVGINVIGLRRRGFSNEAIENIQHAYRVIFQSKLTTKEALSQLTEMLIHPEVNQIVEFVNNSKRGIVRKGSVVELSSEEM